MLFVLQVALFGLALQVEPDAALQLPGRNEPENTEALHGSLSFKEFKQAFIGNDSRLATVPPLVGSNSDFYDEQAIAAKEAVEKALFEKAAAAKKAAAAAVARAAEKAAAAKAAAELAAAAKELAGIKAAPAQAPVRQPTAAPKPAPRTAPLPRAQAPVRQPTAAPKPALANTAPLPEPTYEFDMIVPAGVGADRKINFDVDGVTYSMILPEGVAEGDTFRASITVWEKEQAEKAKRAAEAEAAAERAAVKNAAADKAAADKAAAAKPKPEIKPEAEPAAGGISAKTLAKIGGAGTGKTVGPSGSFAWSGKDGSVHCAYASCTHIGGTGPAEGGPNHSSPSKKNQDAYFCAQLSDDTVVWGVLDGHGPDNGGLVAERASAALIEWFESHVDELKPEKAQSAMKRAFEHAHTVVREAIVRKYTELGTPLRTTSEGFLVDSTNLPIDGGTTVTVVALLQGHLLVVANVGDSDCLLGGVLADGTIGFEQLCADHTPMSVEEYVRVARLTESRGEDWEPANFVYDADNSNDVLEIFAVSEEGQVQVDKELQGRLDDLGVGYKTTRGDRPTALVVPETSKYGMQRLGMTRSLGDFYMQYHGCTFEPEVSCIDLFDLVTQLKHVTVIVASDGLWDIWAYKDVLKEPLKATESSGGSGLLQPAKVQATLDALVEETRKETAEMFGDSADNISAVCISFDSIAPKT